MPEILSSTVGQLGLLFASWSVVTGGIWKLFERVERVTSADAKGEVAAWIRQLQAGAPLRRLAHFFTASFDAVFGTKHLSWRCFYRSCVASLVVVICLYLLWAALRPLEVADSVFITGIHSAQLSRRVAFVVLLVTGTTVIYNFIPD